MKQIYATISACLLLLLTGSGCQTKPRTYEPAYINELSAAQLQEVGNVIQRDLGLTAPPLLTATAFQDSHILVLTPALASTPLGKLATGRSIEAPTRFHLLSDGNSCVLQNVASGHHEVLSFPCLEAKPDLLSRDIWIASRGIRIPVTLHVPPNHDQPLPLVILAHGHGGTRHEAGGFTQVAEALAQQGIASVRMDFPGCGDSTESFAQNNLQNMLADIEASLKYSKNVLQIDPARVGILGFSMGGRLALLYSQSTALKSMALWAPAATDGSSSMIDSLGGQPTYATMKRRARDDGAVPFTTAWGQQQLLGYQWFTDLEKSKPSEAISQYNGNLFVLYGNLDQVVKPPVSQSVYQQAGKAASRQIYIVEQADHGLGLFSNQPELTAQAVNQTVEFFTQNL